MDIRNVTEFRNFVNSNQLRGLHKDIEAVSICVMEYERECNCWKNNDRQKIYENCKSLYTKAVGTVINSFKPHFLSHVSDQNLTFYLSGRPIGTMRR
jgi:hypothetical protein